MPKNRYEVLIMPTDWLTFVSVMNDEKSKELARATFSAYLESRKLRHTTERDIVLEKVLEMPDNFSVDSLHASLAQAEMVSLATVYNTMQLLTGAGIVRRHTFDGTSSRYERASPANENICLHLVCTECGKIKAVKDTEISRAINSRRFPTFHTAYFTLCIYGVCSRCARRLKKKQTN